MRALNWPSLCGSVQANNEIPELNATYEISYYIGDDDESGIFVGRQFWLIPQTEDLLIDDEAVEVDLGVVHFEWATLEDNIPNLSWNDIDGWLEHGVMIDHNRILHLLNDYLVNFPWPNWWQHYSGSFVGPS